MISITLNFPSVTQATTFLSAGQRALDGVIDHADRPDVGAEATVKPADDPAAVFGSAVVPAAPPVPAAPSTAAVVPFPTAPVETGVTSPAVSAVAPSVPTPAPSAVAPTAPATPTSPAGAAELDSSGLRWDERIHAGNKSTNKDGTWRQKRGVDPLVVARVEAELRLGQPAAAVTVTTVPVPPAQPAVPPVPPAATVPVPPAPAPVAVVAPPAPVQPAPAGHPSFADVLTNVVKTGKSQDEIGKALASLGPVAGYPNGIAAFGELASAAVADPSVMTRFAQALGL